ncbi:hypothetical protein M0R45_028688 [Rubus argutus]|uniref:KRR1 small subunit processome component second KH domain-containing protein n=1 Tax=Rubus argutus TaxID=59490 RepID=A0AAW1W6Q5_RUBAR
MASSSSSVHAQIIDGLSSSESNSMETEYNSEPFDGVLFSRECRSSDEFSICYSRKFPKSTGQNLQGSLQTVKSTVALYGFSCELNMDNWYGEMTFTTSRTNSKENIDRATTALHLLQLNVPAPTALKVFSGSFSDIILTGNPGLCSRFSIEPDLERVASCDICMGEGIVIFVGSSQGVKMVRQIVQDCIVHNVHPVRWVTTFKRVLAMKRLEALRL